MAQHAHRPNPEAQTAKPPLAADLVKLHVDALCGTMRISGEESEPAKASRRDAARFAFESLQPRDAIEAMVATEAIAAHHAIIDCFRRAMLPDTTAEAATRLRNNAATLSRMKTAALRTLAERHAPAPPSREPASRPPIEPQPPVQPKPEAHRTPEVLQNLADALAWASQTTKPGSSLRERLATQIFPVPPGSAPPFIPDLRAPAKRNGAGSGPS